MTFARTLAAAAFGADWVVSVADCSFVANRDEFLGRQSRDRREIYERARKLSRAAVAAPVSAGQIAQRNFIDQEIFGKLTKINLLSAPLASDEEFLRRIYLDLTGRIPDSGEIRAFLADASETKRDTVIYRLLDSPEYTDRWTMWMGDLLQNTSKLANAAINRNVPGRNMFHAYIRDAVSSDKPLRAVAIDVITGKGNNYDAQGGPANFPMGASTSMGPVQDTYDTMLVRTASTFLGMAATTAYQHHWLAIRMRQEGIDFEQSKNAFLRCSNPERLQELADSLTTRDLLQCGQKWLTAFTPFFTSQERQQVGCQHRPFFSQVEYCDNLIFCRRAAVDEFAERLLDTNRTIGQPKKITMIFGRKITKESRANSKPSSKISICPTR